MRFKEILEVKIDNVRGIGAVPDNQEVDYKGMKVLMRPSTFLKLAAPLDKEPEDKIINHIRQGGAIGAPFLLINIPQEWEEGNFDQPLKIIGHEGRNRMKAIMKLEGNDLIEVHLLLSNGMRARHLTPEIKDKMIQGATAERSSNYISGPLYKEIT